MVESKQTALLEGFRAGLLNYGLGSNEINVLIAVMINGKSTIPEIRKNPKCRFYSKTKINQILKNLCKTGWLQQISSDSPTFTLVSKKDFQNTLDLIINKTQDLFMAQKNGAYDLLNTVKTYEQQSTTGVGDDKGFKINPKTPDFIKNWLVTLLKTKSWRVVKSEGYMAVSLTNEGIAFKLSSAEFEVSLKDTSSYAGVFLCEFEDTATRDSLLARIHQYNEDALKFNYKMERKGYTEGRNRHLIESEMKPSQKDTNGFISEFNLKFDGNKDVTGKILTYPLKGNAVWAVSIWAENSDIIKSFKLTSIH